MTSTLEYLVPQIKFIRVPVLATGTTSAGNQFKVAADGTLTNAPVRQNIEIETSINYTTVMTWRRFVVDVHTPEIEDAVVGERLELTIGGEVLTIGGEPLTIAA